MKLRIRVIPPRTFGNPEPQEQVIEATLFNAVSMQDVEALFNAVSMQDVEALFNLEQHLNSLTDHRFHLSLENNQS